MLLTAEHKMSAVTAALVLVILGAFVHCSDAINCYECASEHGGWCDDPLDLDRPYPYNIRKVSCIAKYDACWRGEVSALWGKNIKSFLFNA